MKEIRFRAWEKDYKYMNYKVMVGNVWNEENYQWVAPERVDYECEPGWKHFDENSNIELMQNTGLKDKNGMVIYEGDIVQTGWQGNEKGVVVFDFESSTYCVDSGDGHMYFNHPESYEVIGNVYENSELLEDDGK